MKLELLFKRESFKEIFNKSISNFISNHYDRRVKITWGKKLDDVNNILFYFNSKLNIIYPSDISIEHLFDVSKEYIYHKNKIICFIHFIYVYLFTKTFLRKNFLNKIYFNSTSFEISNVIFLPGNNSIRLLDFNSKSCFVINKLDKNINIFKKSIELRKSLKVKSIPKIKKVYSNFFQEEMISAIPINRIRSNSKCSKILSCVHSDLNTIYKSNYYNINLGKYVDKTNSYLNSYDRKLIIQNNSVANRIRYLVDFISKNFDKNTVIPITLTHGDFQNSNILVNENNYYIIDWEFINYRFLYYDYFTYIFSSRNPIGISSRVNKWINDSRLKFKIENWANENILFERINSTKYYVTLFFIEELLFRINENVLSNTSNNPGLEIILNELKSISIYEK